MMKVGEQYYVNWVGCTIKCVEDNNEGCSACIFSKVLSDGESSCPERVYNQYPCYHSDREDGKDVHYVKVDTNNKKD